MRLRTVLSLALVALAPSVRAAPFPARGGETGLLDVPDAEVLPAGTGMFGGEFRFDHRPGSQPDVGPMPISIVGGTGRRFDVGLSLREWGRPGDPHPSPLLFNAALKYHLLDATDYLPSLAVDVTADRFNWKATSSTHLIASTPDLGRVRFAGFLGVDGLGGGPGKVGPSTGLAASLALNSKYDAVAEALAGPGGPLFGAALRWSVTPVAGFSFGVSWLPRDSGVRFSIGLGLSTPTRRRVRKDAPKPKTVVAVKEKASGPVFLDDRPHFRLRIRGPATADGDARHLQYGLVSALQAPVATAEPQATHSSVRNLALSADDQAARDLDRRDEQLDARQRRLAAAEAGITSKEHAQQQQALELSRLEHKSLERQKSLDARDAALRGGPPTDRERQLVVSEGQFRSAEQDLQTQRLALRSISEAASQRQAGAHKKQLELQEEVLRLSKARSAERQAARVLEMRRQLVAARNAHLSALDEQLAAAFERQDVMERSLRVWTEQLAAAEKRQTTQSDRLTLVEQRKSGVVAATATAPSMPVQPPPAAGALVKVPPVPAPATATARQDPIGYSIALGAPRHLQVQPSPAEPSSSIDFSSATVLAATVVYFPDSSASMQDLDREALAGVARVARDGATVLVRARAKDEPGLTEAARRGDEVKKVLVLDGVPASAIVLQTAVRPNAKLVDVVVSAIRGRAAAPAPKRGAPPLVPGSEGAKQLHQVLSGRQASVERCVNTALAEKHPTRAAGAIKLSFSAEGRIEHAAADEALGGAGLARCLEANGATWGFPSAGAPYSAEFPITAVISGVGQ
ncbi:MAG TPA: hypothetical protein VFE30_02110 [Anaeromyxobacteraceae bacterium]|nr:hypothetical protein [Anaeromyxobacteraceae bacterium]